MEQVRSAICHTGQFELDVESLVPDKIELVALPLTQRHVTSEEGRPRPSVFFPAPLR
jgi:hypothetical protein